MRLEPECIRNRVGNHGAAALADILRRRARDQPAALDRDFDLRAGLPDVEPVTGRDPDAAAIASALCCRVVSVAPDVEPQRPVIQPLPVRIGIPSLAQADRIDLHLDRGFIDRLFQRKGHRRSAGPAERRAGRQIADDVEIGEFFRLRRIDQPRQTRERRVGGGARIGIGGERQRLEIARAGGQQCDLHFGGGTIAGDGELFMPVIRNSDRRFRRARQLDRRHRLHAKARLRAKAAADMIGDDAHLVVVELVAFGDQLLQVEYRLRGNMHGEAVAVETRHRRMRLQAGMLLRGGAENALRPAAGPPSRARCRASFAPSWPSSRMPPMARADCRSTAPVRRRLPRRCRPSCGSPCRTRQAHPVFARHRARSPTAFFRWKI